MTCYSDPVEFGYHYAVNQHLGNLWVFDAEFKWISHCPWIIYLPNLVFAELLVKECMWWELFKAVTKIQVSEDLSCQEEQ